jgi:transposase
MGRLEDVDAEEIRAKLELYESYRPIRRLLAAAIYKEGPSVPQIASWFGVRDATVYNWFDRLESEPLNRAAEDRSRSGRPAKLSSTEWDRFVAAVSVPPLEAGYHRGAWSPPIADRFLENEFGVNYSRRHVRRLLNAARNEQD